jgi:hypothetical protein
MATILNIAINHSSIENIASVLNEYYELSEPSVNNFALAIDLSRRAGCRSFILHKKMNENWVQIDIQIINLYELDEVLRRLTEAFSTIAFFAYNQTTSGSFRFAIFEKGKMKRSLFKKYNETHRKVYVVDNFGKQQPFEEIAYAKLLNKQVPSEELLDYEVFFDWSGELGFVWDGQERESATCFKVLGTRN